MEQTDHERLNLHHTKSLPDHLRSAIPLLVSGLALLVLATIPLRIIGFGFLPPDDALRHAAKVVSDRPWSDILVLREDIKMDHNYGWHVILGLAHRWAGLQTDGLVAISVISLFLVFALANVPWLKRPEAWLAALLIAIVADSATAYRFFLGRPFLITMTGLMSLLWLAQNRGDRKPGWGVFFIQAGVIAACVFIHGLWYLWFLMVVSFLLAGRFRWGLVFGASWAVGSLAGAALTGHPFTYLSQAVQIAFATIGKPLSQAQLVSELQGFNGDFQTVVVFIGLVVARVAATRDFRYWPSQPAFWLICLAWILGFQSTRFWNDWGFPALLVLLASHLSEFLARHTDGFSPRRLVLAGFLGAALFLAYSSDRNSRWTENLTLEYLTPDKKDLAGWLPEKGGIIYSTDMDVFYQTFFKNPHAEWRYILGFEATFMPEEDFKILQRIRWNFDAPQAYEGWIKKMRPQDRLIMRGVSSFRPAIPQLEWYYGATKTWIGRLPRPKVNAETQRSGEKKARGTCASGLVWLGRSQDRLIDVVGFATLASRGRADRVDIVIEA
jgi:hypothetical protein